VDSRAAFLELFRISRVKTSKSIEVNAMQAKWAASVCSVVLILGLGAIGQENGSSNDPILKTRPNDRNTPDDRNTPAPQQRPGAAYPGQGSPSSTYGAPPNAIPDGSRFIIKLKDTLDTKKMQDGKHFKAELREDLVTPSGLIIPKGRTIKGHVGRFEHGFTGSKMQLALDEIETRNGWVPLIGTVTGVPGDPSIKASGEEGEVYRKGPDKRKVVTDAAIGATVGAGLGTGTSYLFKGGEMKLEKGTQLEVRLDRDLVVPTH
jgi:hypothetical protein